MSARETKIIVILPGGGEKSCFLMGAWNKILSEGLNFGNKRTEIEIPTKVFGTSKNRVFGSLISKGKNKELFKHYCRATNKSLRAISEISFQGAKQSISSNFLESETPLIDAVNYAEKNSNCDFYFVIISSNKQKVMIPRSSRIRSKIIQASRELGSLNTFSRSMIMDSFIHGLEQANRVLSSHDWE